MRRVIILVSVLAIVTMACSGTAATGSPEPGRIPEAPASPQQEAPQADLAVEEQESPTASLVETPRARLTPAPVGITPTAEASPTCWEDETLGEGWQACVNPETLGYDSMNALFASALVITTADGVPFDGVIVAIAWAGVSLSAWAIVSMAEMPMTLPSLAPPPIQYFDWGQTLDIPVDRVTHPKHHTFGEGTWAQNQLNEMVRTWTGSGGPQNEVCKALVVVVEGVEYTTRVAWWKFTHINPVSGKFRGVITWAHASDPGTAQGIYEGKSFDSLKNVPGDIAEKYPNSRWEDIICPGGPPLQGAH